MPVTTDEYAVKIVPRGLQGDLAVPARATGLILFAHGSGSSRHSPRNRFVANALQQRGHATLLLDLLTMAEEQADFHTGRYRFDIDLLVERLLEATVWVQREPATRGLSIGYFGASTGAGAALVAAAERASIISAVVSRGGRPDLAGSALGRVKAPTLLIVGSHDFPVIKLNRQALSELRCEKELSIVPGATHLFEEPGALEQIGKLAGMWFDRHLQDKVYDGNA